MNARRALVWAVRGVVVAGTAMLVLGLVSRRRPVDPTWPLWVASVLLGALAGAAAWVRGRPSVADVARLADRALGGAERLSTAWEWRDADGPLVSRQRADAVTWAGDVDARGVVTVRPRRREMAAAAVVVLAAGGLAALPNPALARQRTAAGERAVREKAADGVARLARQAAAGGLPGQDPSRRQALVRELRLSEEAVRKASTREGAVAALSRAQEALRTLGDPSGDGRMNAAAGAGAALSQSPTGAAAGAALAGAGGAAAEALRQMADRLPSLNGGERSALAAQLAEAAGAAGNPSEAAALIRAADALAAGDTQSAQAALAQAAADRQEADAEAAAKALEALADSIASQAPADQAALAQALERAATAATADRPLADQLARAAAALRTGDLAKAADALRAAGDRTKALPAEAGLDTEVAKDSNKLEGLKTSFALENPRCGSSSFAAGSPGERLPTAPKSDDKGQCGGKSKKDATQHQASAGDGSASGAAPGGGAGAGQGGPGAGQSQGEGQGQSGQGTSGQGSGGQRSTPTPGGASQGTDGPGSGGRSGAHGGLGPTPGTPSEQVYVPGLPGQGRSLPVGSAGTGPGAGTGLVPYESVYGQYRAAALSQADRQVIPEELRDLLRTYFQEASP